MQDYIFSGLVQRHPRIVYSDYLQILNWIRSSKFDIFSKNFDFEFPHLIEWRNLILNSDILEVSNSLEKDLKQNISWLLPGDENFPRCFMNLSEPPFCIRMKGSTIWKNGQGFAVVGSREPSNFSLSWLEQNLPVVLTDLNLFTVSGGARGVDQRTHSISLRLGLPTLVLLPSGLRSIYPYSLACMEEMILAAGGSILSEYFSESAMRKYYFQERNRLIPALAVGTLVVDAKRRSGTMITAQQSAQQGCPLFVLPSHPMDPCAAGGLDLICDGATPVRDAQDLCGYLRGELLSIT